MATNTNIKRINNEQHNLKQDSKANRRIRNQFSGEREKEFHDYADNTVEELELLLKHHVEELELLLKHHEEDLQEYIDRGDDEEDINHVREDIREIENELKGR